MTVISESSRLHLKGYLTDAQYAELTRAEGKGRTAFYKGEKEKDCPYPYEYDRVSNFYESESAKRIVWLEGFHNARNVDAAIQEYFTLP